MNTIIASRGRSRETSLRLCSRAPRTTRRSATPCPVLESWPGARRSDARSGRPAPGRRPRSRLTRGTDNHIPGAGGRRPAYASPRARSPRRGPRRPRAVDVRRSGPTLDATSTTTRPAGPPCCPGWSVGHVLTHVARNADGMRPPGRLGAHRRADPDVRRPSRPAPPTSRPGAGRSAAVLAADVPRLRRAAGRRPGPARESADAEVAGPAAALRSGTTGRRPRHARAGACPTPGRREVEIHHVDLGLGYGPARLARRLRRAHPAVRARALRGRRRRRAPCRRAGLAASVAPSVGPVRRLDGSDPASRRPGDPSPAARGPGRPAALVVPPGGA